MTMVRGPTLQNWSPATINLCSAFRNDSYRCPVDDPGTAIAFSETSSPPSEACLLTCTCLFLAATQIRAQWSSGPTGSPRHRSLVVLFSECHVFIKYNSDLVFTPSPVLRGSYWRSQSIVNFPWAVERLGLYRFWWLNGLLCSWDLIIMFSWEYWRILGFLFLTLKFDGVNFLHKIYL